MARCEYRHRAFAFGDVFNPFNPTTYLNDGSDQCWMLGDDVAEFTLPDGSKKYYCLFHLHHAPDGAERKSYRYDGLDIDGVQSKRLKELLDKWNVANGPTSKNECLLTFAFPGIRCGELSLIEIFFSSDIDFMDSTFSCYVMFDSPKFAGKMGFDRVEFHGATLFKSATFDKITSFASSKFNGDAVFDSAKFADEALFNSAEFGRDAIFDSAEFSRIANFDSAKFGGVAFFHLTMFGEHAMFDEATFSGNAKFLKSTFNGVATFPSSTFKEQVNFQWSKFNSISQFEKTKFNKSANFIGGIHFLDRSNFNNAVFGENAGKEDNASFDSAIFHNDLSFHGTIFKEKLNFNLTEIKKGGRFTDCEFASLTYSTHLGERLLFNHCSGAVTFADQDCSRLAFLNMNLDNADFLGADVSQTRFEACRWEKPKDKPRYAIAYGHDKIIKSGDRENLFKLKSLYRQLMKNLEDSRDFKQAGDFHYRDMELRKLLIDRGLTERESRLELSLLKMYRFFADYGESYTWLGLWILVWWLLITPTFVVGIETVGNGIRHGFGNIVFSLDYAFGVAKVAIYKVVQANLQCPTDTYLCEMNIASKLFIIFATSILLSLLALFVMAVNRRFRR